MEFTTIFSKNCKQLMVLNNFKFKFKYESKISGNAQIKHTGQICLKQWKYYSTRKIIVICYNHESDSIIERQTVTNNIKRKFSETDINEIPSKIIRNIK